MKKFKKVVVLVIVLAVISAGIYYKVSGFGNANIAYLSSSDSAATTTPKMKTERVKDLIDQLAIEAEQSPKFIEETKAQEKLLESAYAEMKKELYENRKKDARAAAIFIVQTQYEMEVYDLKQSDKVVKN